MYINFDNMILGNFRTAAEIRFPFPFPQAQHYNAPLHYIYEFLNLYMKQSDKRK